MNEIEATQEFEIQQQQLSKMISSVKASFASQLVTIAFSSVESALSEISQQLS